jgi:hypothetical protein
MNKTPLMNIIFIVISITLIQLLIISNTGADWFEDVTEQAGTTHSGDSFGAAWGDANNDGWPDFCG